MTKIIAHRGASAHAPENTLVAFALAVEMQADMVELDVHLSKDGHLVVIHDSTFDRTTTGSGNVAECTLEELKQLDAGGWFGAKFSGERVPTLAEALHTIDSGCEVNVEIKYASRYPGIGRAVSDCLKATGRPLTDFVVSSFEHAVLDEVKHHAPDLPVAPLFSKLPSDLASLRGEYLHPSHKVVDAEVIRRATAQAQRVNAWTVNDEEGYRRLIDLGVHGIITDKPDALVAFLRR